MFAAQGEISPVSQSTSMPFLAQATVSPGNAWQNENGQDELSGKLQTSELSRTAGMAVARRQQDQKTFSNECSDECTGPRMLFALDSDKEVYLRLFRNKDESAHQYRDDVRIDRHVCTICTTGSSWRGTVPESTASYSQAPDQEEMAASTAALIEPVYRKALKQRLFNVWRSIITIHKIEQRMFRKHCVALLKRCFSALRDKVDCIIAGRRFSERYHEWRAEMFISNTASSISGSVRTDKSSMDAGAYFLARRLRASIFEDWLNMMCLARLEQEIIVAHLVSVLRRVVFAWKARMELNQEYQLQVLKYQKVCEQLEIGFWKLNANNVEALRRKFITLGGNAIIFRRNVLNTSVAFQNLRSNSSSTAPIGLLTLCVTTAGLPSPQDLFQHMVVASV